MSWSNTYRPTQIGPGEVISTDRPGMKIANAITEIQDRAVTTVDATGTGGLTLAATITGNVLSITGEVDECSGGDSLPPDGDQYQVLQRDGSGAAVWDWVRAHS